MTRSIVTKILVAFSFIFVAFSVPPPAAEAAVLYVRPRAGVFLQESAIPAAIRLDTEDQTVNAVETTIRYPKNFLKIVSVGESGSPIAIWQKPPTFSNETGELSFAGGIPGGFNGKTTLLNVVIQFLDAGTGGLSFDPGTLVLLHDGKATPAPLALQDAIWQAGKALARNITSPTHQNGVWSRSQNAVISWPIRDGWEYSYLFTNDLSADLDESPDDPREGSLAFEALDDGIYRFSVIARENAGGDWLDMGTFLVLIDRTPPKFFEARLTDAIPTGGGTFVSFAARDETSGITRYELCEGGTCHLVSNPAPITNPKARVTIKATDYAGNAAEVEVARFAKTEEGSMKFGWFLGGAAILAIAAFIALRKRRNPTPQAVK